MHLGRCRFFWLWSLLGAALLLSVVSYIGVFTAIPALVALYFLARRSPRWPEPLGLLAGFGALCLLVAGLNWDRDGVDPTPWLTAGIVLVALGVAGYGFSIRSSSP
jgi:hypothetical protein